MSFRFSFLLPIFLLSIFPANGQNSPATPSQHAHDLQLKYSTSTPQAPGSRQQPDQVPQNLTLKQAEMIAIQNQPRIQEAKYLAASAAAHVTEAKSIYYPQAYGNITGAEAENNSRITAGALNNPSVYDRFADGLTVSQFITDFGRTHQLVKSNKERAQAQAEDVTTSRADVLLRADQAFFNALKAQSVLQVAQQTVQNRQVVANQITTLAQHQLKSDLDVSFAQVDLGQAQLLLVQAQNDVQATLAELSAALGFTGQQSLTLTDEPLTDGSAPGDADKWIQEGLQNRPEILSERLQVNAAQSYATAEHELWLPTISAVGTAGVTPFRQEPLTARYAAAGFNVNIPLFNGRLYGALESEASNQAHAEQQRLRDLQDTVARDVRTAWLNANSAYQRLGLTRQISQEADQALNLAQSRYKLGLGSIVELSQAQLNDTQAQIAQTTAKFDYQSQLAVLNYAAGLLH
jgi:outer membrane protein